MIFNQEYLATDSAGRAPRHRSVQGWLELGGKRYYMKSIWERNIARYLEWLKIHKQILEWEYEPKTFVFEAIKFGNRTCTPDFRITELSGKQHWLEVKGWMDPTSKTKLSRMARYFPAERVEVLGKEEYYALRRDLRNAFEWETMERAA